MTRVRALLSCCLLLAACVTAGRRSTAATVEGAWFFTVDVGTAVTRGAMTLVPANDGWRGTLTTSAGNNVLPVRSFTRTGQDVRLVVESPNGLVIFDGILASDAQEMRGTVTYHTGQRFPMVVTRRAPVGA